MSAGESLPGPQEWRPRYPDPALADTRPPGLRAHRHTPNRIHTWVVSQHQVWVDYWGNEIEIETMELPYVANVLGFVRGQAARLRELVAFDLLSEQVEHLEAGSRFDAQAFREIASAYDVDAVAWLDQTPLVQALNRRLESRS